MEKADDDEQSKEAKIDEFFALVRSFRPREAQNQPRIQVCEESEGASSAMKMPPPPAASQGSPAAEETASSSWVPSFKLEDFREGNEIKSPSEGVEATKEKETLMEEVERDEVESPIFPMYTHPDSTPVTRSPG